MTLPTVSLIACIWVYGTGIDGTRGLHGGLKSSMKKLDAIRESRERSREDRAREIASMSGLEYRWQRSNRAAELMLLGRPRESIKILEQLEKEDPGDYEIAANLGTAYELAGQNLNALEWIRIGRERNPDSHYGTEWVHELILERKVDGQSTVFNRDGFLGWEHPVQDFVYDEKPKDSWDLYSSIGVQAIERVAFIKSNDPLMSDLFLELGIRAGHLSTLEDALPFLELAREYGHANPQLVDDFIAETKSLIFWGDVRIVLYWVFGISAFVLLVRGLRRRSRRRKAREQEALAHA